MSAVPALLHKPRYQNLILPVLALLVSVMHIVLNRQYGFHRDELDILMNARQLDWGYISYPPFTTLIARLGLELFGASLVGTRLFSAISQGICVLLIGQMARDLGGKLPAQVLAALAAAIAPVALMAGTLIQYMAFDYFWWVVVLFFTVRLLRTENPRYWLGIGAGIGMGMQTKYTIAFLVAGLVAGVLLTPARRYLRSPWLYAGAGVAVLIFLPNLLWQIRHDFITLDFLSSIHARDIAWGRMTDFWTEQFLLNAHPLTLPLWIAGLYFLLFHPSGKRFRLLVVTFLVTLGLFVVSRGRAYYVGPAYTILLTAGAVYWESVLANRRETLRKVGWGVTWGWLVISAGVGIVLVKPVAPINSSLWEITSGVNEEVVEMVGWPDLVKQVAAIYNRLPAEEKSVTGIVAGNYGEAGALDLYGAQYGLPQVISGSNSLWYRGYGDPAPQMVILVGFLRGYADQFFRDCTFSGTVTNPYDVKNEESQNHNSLYVCKGLRIPWEEIWPRMHWYQ